MLAASRFVSFVRDFDVEVAQNSVMAEPKVDALFCGTRLGLDVSPMADGRLYVRLGLQHADVEEPIASLDLRSEELGAVDLPQVRVD